MGSVFDESGMNGEKRSRPRRIGVDSSKSPV